MYSLWAGLLKISFLLLGSYFLCLKLGRENQYILLNLICTKTAKTTNFTQICDFCLFNRVSHDTPLATLIDSKSQRVNIYIFQKKFEIFFSFFFATLANSCPFYRFCSSLNNLYVCPLGPRMWSFLRLSVQLILPSCQSSP